MVIENQLPPFLEWLPAALVTWLIVTACLGVAALVISYLIAAVRHGPLAGGDVVYKALVTAVTDLVRTSPRRVLALAGLAVKEAIQRRILVVLAVFVLILLFAGWFLDKSSAEPAKLYLSFVLTATTYLVLLLALFLSAFSLPADVKNRTLHTIVTKPVRAGEIVLGRIVGFSAVGTMLLAVMGGLSYPFVVGALRHTHEVATATIKGVPQKDNPGRNPIVREGRTATVNSHHHTVSIYADGTATTDEKQGHWHAVTVSTNGGETTFELGPPEGYFAARVPVYGTLRFRDRKGEEVAKGINVGDEWMYRSYIEGGSLAAAIWKFENIDEEHFPDGLPLELTLGVFRTYKGNIEEGIPGKIVVRNPRSKLEATAAVFTAKEFAVNQIHVPLVLRRSGAKEDTVELFKDLVSNGEVEIQLTCLKGAQLFGVAQPDLYLRARDAVFWTNFVKGYLGIWFQMVLVTSFGVMFSTFLNGAVAMMATLAVMAGGIFSDFMLQLANGTLPGGGPTEAFFRIITQQNVTSELEPGLGATMMQMVDAGLKLGLKVAATVLPDFPGFSDVDFVAYGFDIAPDRIFIHTTTAVGFLLALVVAGTFFFKTREVAQ